MTARTSSERLVAAPADRDAGGMTRPPPGEGSWPEFDRWQAAFAAAGVFPATWEGLHVVPSPRSPEAAVYQLRKLVLLSEWLDMLARRSTVRAHYARRGIRARVVRQDTGSPCPVCDPLNAREVGSGPDAMPPFHPGCRCVLVAMRTVPAGRRGASSARSRSRVG